MAPIPDAAALAATAKETLHLTARASFAAAVAANTQRVPEYGTGATYFTSSSL